jgi:hypothetical protein
MKTIVLVVFFVASAHASKLTATGAFRQILPYDTFHGQTSEGEDCVVDVLGSANHTTIEIEAFGITRFVLVNSAPYTWDLATRAFSSSLLISNSGGSGQTEVTFSTTTVQNKLRIAIQRTHRVEGRQWTSVQECSI